MCDMERERKLSLYFIVAQFAISIYLMKTRIHGIGTHLRLSLSAILNPLVCCETQHSNQNRSSHWLKREFRDVKDVLIFKTESARRWSNKWTKTLYQDYLHCIANFCRALLIIFSKQFISSNTKRRKRMLNFV